MSKKQWKTIDLSLQFSTKTDWSLEEVDTQLSDVNSIRSSLPTKTNATRQTAELDNISENGPFILNYANMSFDASETDLMQFFRAYQIMHVEFNNPRRGCGYIEFTNINDLAGAWKLNEKVFINRPLRLSIPLKDDIVRQSQNNGTKQKFQSNSKTSTFDMDDSANWRTKKSQPTNNNDSSTVKKDDDQSNWRTRTSRDTVAANITSEESNWRSRAPAVASKNDAESADSAWRRAAPVSSADNASTAEETNWRSRAPTVVSKNATESADSAWRRAAPVSTTDNASTVEETNWRSRAPVAAPTNNVVPDTSAWRKVAPREVQAPTTVAESVNWRRSNQEKVATSELKTVDTMLKSVNIENKSTVVEKPSAWGAKKSVAVDSQRNGDMEPPKTEPTVLAPKTTEPSSQTVNAWRPRQQTQTTTDSTTPINGGSVQSQVPVVAKTTVPTNAWSRGAPKSGAGN